MTRRFLLLMLLGKAAPDPGEEFPRCWNHWVELWVGARRRGVLDAREVPAWQATRQAWKRVDRLVTRYYRQLSP